MVEGEGQPKTFMSERDEAFGKLDVPSLEALAFVLRHPETWPPGFYWDYSGCETCAMGLAHLLWSRKVAYCTCENGASEMARVLAIPYETARAIFFNANRRHRYWGIIPRNKKRITPEMVASDIEDVIDQNKYSCL